MTNRPTPSFRRRWLASAVFFAAAALSWPLTSSADTESPYDGMNGRQILEHIRATGRPARILTSSREVRDAILSYALTPSGAVKDYFSKKPLTSYDNATLLPVVPAAWFGESSADYSSVVADLHNIVPANSEVVPNRRDFPPGKVAETIYTNGFWKAGIGSLADMETNFYEPAEKLKGDFSRIYFYMAAVYPQPLWNSRGAMLFADGFYPLLTPYGKEILLEWHRSDPVDDAERQRDSAIAAVQGNTNPFVSHPALAEYIWGRYADETYRPSTPSEPSEPTRPDDPDVEPIMLKAVYSVAADKRIDFRSPYVDAGSQWQLDGAIVDGSSVALDALTLGRHEITYSNDRAHGKIIITVEP